MLTRRPGAGFCALLLAVTLSGCTPSVTAPDTSRPPEVSDYAAYQTEYAGRRGFAALSPEQQDNYGALYTAVTRLEGDTVLHYSQEQSTKESLGIRVELPRELTTGDAVNQLFTAFLTDNPQFFYLGSVYTYEGYKVGSHSHYNVLYLTLLMNAREREEATARLEERVTTLLEGTDGLSDPDRELLLHDRLAEACAYDDKASAIEAPDTEYPFAFNAYGALVQGRAVCEGYARSFQLLCQRAGLPCTLVNGTDKTTGAAHMWNLVTLDGADYHVDVTWDDKMDTVLHVYCNLTTEEVTRTHRLDSDSPAGTDCTATAAAYYTATGRYQPRYDRAAIAAAVAAAVTRGETMVELQFPVNRLSSVGVFVSNRSWFSEAVNAYLPEGSTLWDYAYYTYAEYGVLVLRKKA